MRNVDIHLLIVSCCNINVTDLNGIVKPLSISTDPKNCFLKYFKIN